MLSSKKKQKMARAITVFIAIFVSLSLLLSTLVWYM